MIRELPVLPSLKPHHLQLLQPQTLHFQQPRILHFQQARILQPDPHRSLLQKEPLKILPSPRLIHSPPLLLPLPLSHRLIQPDLQPSPPLPLQLPALQASQSPGFPHPSRSQRLTRFSRQMCLPAPLRTYCRSRRRAPPVPHCRDPRGSPRRIL